MNTFILTFIPIFIAMDPIGNIPLFLGLTQGMSKTEVRKLVWQAIMTALFVGLIFGMAGHWILKLTGVTTADFQIAGGILLFIYSMKELFGSTVKKPAGSTPDKLIGVVPLGVPLIVGPAVMTTLLILHDLYAYTAIFSAFAVNLAIMAFLLLHADKIVKRVGEATTHAVTKVVAIFLAAIGIMMIRKGILAGFTF